mmetsp:Transcript_27442/g.76948  ORF Transcript_27442/g.76948 Transcript_27442/m.76948 type:complete len:233 (+) Transcript_27442:77-775(+)
MKRMYACDLLALLLLIARRTASSSPPHSFRLICLFLVLLLPLGLLCCLLGLLFSDFVQDLLSFLVGLLFCLEVGGKGQAGDSRGSRWEEQDGALEVRDLSGVFVKARVRCEEAVSDAFVDAQTGGSDVAQVTECEWHGWELLVDFGQGLSGGLRLQQVLVLNVALVDGRSEFAWSRLSVTCGHCNIDGVHFELLEAAGWHLFVFHILREWLLQRNLLDSVQHVSLHLMHANG